MSKTLDADMNAFIQTDMPRTAGIVHAGYCYKCKVVVRIDPDDRSHRKYKCSQCGHPNVARIVSSGSSELLTVIFSSLRRIEERLDTLEAQIG